MWALKFIPDWIFYGMLLIGIIGILSTSLLKFIPLPIFVTYRIPIKVVSSILIVTGIFMAGAISNEKVWKARVNDLEKQVAEVSLKSNETSAKIVTKYIDRTKIIHQQGEKIIQTIDREIVKYNDICKLPNDVIRLHNEAAKGVNN